MLQVGKTPVAAVLSTGNDTRQHIKMGHTLRAASRLRSENSQFSPSIPVLESPFRNFLSFLRSVDEGRLAVDMAPHLTSSWFSAINHTNVSPGCWLNSLPLWSEASESLRSIRTSVSLNFTTTHGQHTHTLSVSRTSFAADYLTLTGLITRTLGSGSSASQEARLTPATRSHPSHYARVSHSLLLFPGASASFWAAASF